MNTTQQAVEMLKAKTVEFQQNQANQLNSLYCQQQQYVNELIQQIESMGKQIEDSTKKLKSRQRLKKQLSELQQVTHNQNTTTCHSQNQSEKQQNPVVKTTQPPSLVPLKKTVSDTQPVHKRKSGSQSLLVSLKKTSGTNIIDEDKQLPSKPVFGYKPSKRLEQKRIDDERKLKTMSSSVIQSMNTNTPKEKGSF
ncbi:hypothetical protein QTN25_004698 [Entamoeba marina]